MLILSMMTAALFAQLPGGSFSGQGWILEGECEIVMKSGEKIPFNGKIDNTDIKGTDISYRDVDYITLVNTTLKMALDATDYRKIYNGLVFRYINLKGKPCLFQILAEYPKCSFYYGRPHLKTIKGIFQPNVNNLYMIKDSLETVKVDYGINAKKIINKYFKDCPRLVQYLKDKTIQNFLSSPKTVAFIYSYECAVATDEEKEYDKEMFLNLIFDFPYVYVNSPYIFSKELRDSIYNKVQMEKEKLAK